MKDFIQTLEASGYRQFYLAFGDANLRYLDWRRAAAGLSGPLQELVKLFLLHQPLPRRRATELLGRELLAELLQCRVLVQKTGAVESNDFLLLYCRSYAMFCQITNDPFAYFGEDSLALAAYQTPSPGGHVLDLCSGPGLQSFVAASAAAQVTGVEIRKETWRIAELNRRLNHLGDRVKFVCSSAAGFAKTDSRKYDRILFNPPLVPMVPGYKSAFVGDGGEDGFEVTRKILALYHGRLVDGGTIEFIGMDLGRKTGAGCARVRALARRHGLGGRIHVLSRQPIKLTTGMFQSAAYVFARDNGMNLEQALKIMTGHFNKIGAEVCCLFFASLHRPGRSEKRLLSMVDVSKSFLGSWFV